MDTDTDTVFAHVRDERSDTEVEIAVNRGLAVALLEGPLEGLKIMQAAGVPNEICARVLNSTTRRRASDWH
ncbi:hypothetical protein [Solimicrobium silvestre]|uniref:Uncharacterized protein n=1 Tax=Solimicrobium silvestre TaxID=2099400 RepID=A0A2S9GWI8_9BURK|nr:hypothetical protein [Solimicrobium silvestre]PRC92089.1 hypothetical protein S2091_3224 [Solimicrobium silvestre]